MKTFTLKTALLEIIFIVIGILIAVSINNWNEDRKFKAEEHEFLMDLQRSLQADSSDAADNIDGLKRWSKDLAILEKVLESGQPYHDSLDYYFGKLGTFMYFVPSSKSQYEELKSKGFNLIHNQTLRQDFIEYYGFDIFILAKSEELHMNLLNQTQIYFFEHFIGWGYMPAKPVDPKQISDSQLMQLVKSKRNLYWFLLKQYSEQIMPKILSLQEYVCVELENCNH